MGNINVSEKVEGGLENKRGYKRHWPRLAGTWISESGPPHWMATIIYLFESSVSSRHMMCEHRAFLLPARLFCSTWDWADSVPSSDPPLRQRLTHFNDPIICSIHCRQLSLSLACWWTHWWVGGKHNRFLLSLLHLLGVMSQRCHW